MTDNPEAPTVYLCTNGGRDGRRVERILTGEFDNAAPGAPDVYLALSHSAAAARPRAHGKAMSEPKDPTVYLAHAPGRIRQQGDTALRMEDPTVYLAHLPASPSENPILQPEEGVTRKGLNGKLIPLELAPPLLVSYFYVKKFIKEQSRYRYRHWVLDSGAYSAHNSGAEIDLDDYIAFCKDQLATDATLREVFSLDVIGDWRASARNTEKMWAAGVPAIPVYHHREPEDVLRGLARDYPKIALGGMVGLKGDAKKRYVEQCFARVWPKPIHGLGVGSKALVMAVPWHSVDATNWETGPCRFGRWQSYGGKYLPVRGSQHDLRGEIRHYAELEKLARHRWRREMETVGAQLRAAGWRGYTERP